MSYQYSYLIGALIVLVLWTILFLYRKDTRKEMLTISIIFGFIGIVVDPIYAIDWWKVKTITGVIPGVESIIFGFGMGGVASVIYEHFFNKKVKIKKVKKIKEQKRNINLFFIIFLFLILFFGGFIIGINSFKSMIIATITATIVIYIKRPDLIKNSILSGLLLLIASILGYFILDLITPGFFSEFYSFEDIGGKRFLGIPLEEYVFYFLAGAFIGPLYEYWKEGKLINIKS